ncbi:MAG: DsrE family protein [Candidatus Bathyarchaeota archaeon]
MGIEITVNSVVILVTKAPYGHENVYGALYTAIACQEMGVQVTVILLGDGVYSALKKQNPERSIGYPSIENLFYTLLPNCEVLVEKSSLAERGLSKDNLIEVVKITDREGVCKALKEKGKAILTY